MRTAQKKGVSAVTVSDQTGVETFWSLLRKVYDLAGVHLTDISLFRWCSRCSAHGGSSRSCWPWLTAVPSAAAAPPWCNRDRLLDWYAGADRDYARLYPNDFLVWHLLQWGQTQGYQIFDSGGAGHPDKPYGVRDFKERFGGQLVNYGRSVKIHAPWYGLAVKAYDIYRRRNKRA